jgi:hypothetical protein
LTVEAQDLHAAVELCEDLALHDWLLTALLQLIEHSRHARNARPQLINRLQPAIDHLLHLWMPAAISGVILVVQFMNDFDRHLERVRKEADKSHGEASGPHVEKQAVQLSAGPYSQRRHSHPPTPVLGEDHPITLASANNLANDLCALGDYQQARTLNEDTLTRYRRVLGEDHPDTLVSANSSPSTCMRWVTSSRRGSPPAVPATRCHSG